MIYRISNRNISNKSSRSRNDMVKQHNTTNQETVLKNKVNKSKIRQAVTAFRNQKLVKVKIGKKPRLFSPQPIKFRKFNNSNFAHNKTLSHKPIKNVRIRNCFSASTTARRMNTIDNQK